MNRKIIKAGKAAAFRRTLLSMAVAGCFGVGVALAQPMGPQVINGSVNFATQGNILNITNTPNAIINWQGFSIAPNEVTRFIQQSSGSNVLNRVVGQDSSAILGALQSNGKVYLINPNGILFGPNARVDVNGLIASTLDIANQDFLAGKYKFSAGTVAGKLDNQGAITTPGGGQIVLIATDVQNSGIITSPAGEILLAAGKSVQLVDTANPDMAIVVSAPENQALNLGQIVGQGGKVGIYGALINQRGKVSADSAVVGENGKIVFKASKDTLLEAGSVTSATGAGKGGEIQVLGERVGLTGDAKVDVSGQTGGGTVLIGGDYQGKNSAVQNAQHTFIGKDAEIKADAQLDGDGGKVIVWADESTRYYGWTSARGGSHGGDGGFVEASGKQSLVFRGKVDAGAANGKRGTLLLDPADIMITGGTADGATDGTGTFQGSQTTTVGQVVDGAGDAGPSTIYESELEGLPGGTSIILSASNGVTTSGTFTGGVTLPLDSNLSIYTTDVNGTGINLNTPFIASGTGAISLSAGNGGVGSAPLSVYDLTTANRQIDLWAGGALSISGTVNSGTAQTNATAGSSVALTGTGHIQSGLAVLTAPVITLNAVSSIAASNLTLEADSMNLGGSITATTNVTLIPKTIASAKIDLGGADNADPTLGLNATELGTISSPHLTIGASAGAGGITVSAPITLTAVNNLELLTSGNTAINDNLSVPAGGSITIMGPSGDSTKSLTLASTKQIATGGTGYIELAYDKMTLDGTISNSGGDVMLTRSKSTVIPLEVNVTKPGTANQLELTPTELTHVAAGKILLGSSAKPFGNILFGVGSPVDVSANASELALYADLYPGAGTVTQDPLSPITVGLLTVSASQVNLDTTTSTHNMVDAVQGVLQGNPGAFSFKNGKALYVGKPSQSGTGIDTSSSMGAPSVSITTTSGDLSVDKITSPGGSVTLNSAGSIVDTNGTGSNNITANSLVASAGNGMSLDTTVSSLSATNTATNSNGIGIKNTVNLSVTSMTDSSVCGATPPAECTGPAGIKLSTTGTLDIAGSITASSTDGGAHISTTGATTITGGVSGYYIGFDTPSLVVAGPVTSNGYVGVVTGSLTFSTGSISAASGADITSRASSITIGNACVTGGCLLLTDLSTAKVTTPQLVIGRDVAESDEFSVPVAGPIDIKAGINRAAGKIAFLSSGAITQDVAAASGIIADTVGAVTSGSGLAVSLTHASNQFSKILGKTNGGHSALSRPSP